MGLIPKNPKQDPAASTVSYSYTPSKVAELTQCRPPPL